MTTSKRKVRKPVGSLDPELLETARERLLKTVTHDPATGCWVSSAGGRSFRHSVMMVSGRSLLGHRWAWAIWHGGIPANRLVLHNCGRSRCVNPDHLYLSSDPDAPRPSAEELMRARAEGVRKRSKLSWQLVDEIRASDASGRALALRYGVSTSAISSVRCNRTWVRRYGESPSPEVAGAR